MPSASPSSRAHDAIIQLRWEVPPVARSQNRRTWCALIDGGNDSLIRNQCRVQCSLSATLTQGNRIKIFGWLG